MMMPVEEKAVRWLKGQGKEVIYRPGKSPDFIATDGQGYEVKLLFKNGMAFHRAQINRLKAFGGVTILVFTTEGDEPVSQFPFDEVEVPGYYQGFRLYIVADIRDVDPQFWKELKIHCVNQDRTLYKWILDWLRLAVRAEKGLGPNALDVLKNKIERGVE